MKLILGLHLLLLSSFSYGKEISLSFDDAPRPDTAYLTGVDRTDRLIKALEKAGVSQAIFYINAGKITDEKSLARIKSYQKAGHLIGNHTFSHFSANKISKQDFIADFTKGHEYQEKNNILDKYFRYPYLHRGHTLEEVREIRKAVLDLGYTDGYVTIDDYDWYMDRLFQIAVEKKKKINFNQLRKYYIETLLKSIEFYDDLAKKNLGSSPRHVLLLHENDLAALFIGDLVQILKAKGWKIITPKEAYSDSIMSAYPDIKEHGQGRVVAKLLSQEFKGGTRSGYEDERVLDDLFKKYKITD